MFVRKRCTGPIRINSTCQFWETIANEADALLRFFPLESLVFLTAMTRFRSVHTWYVILVHGSEDVNCLRKTMFFLQRIEMYQCVLHPVRANAPRVSISAEEIAVFVFVFKRIRLQADVHREHA